MTPTEKDTKKQQNKQKIQRIMTGYDQHTSPLQLYPDRTPAIINVLLFMKKVIFIPSGAKTVSQAGNQLFIL